MISGCLEAVPAEARSAIIDELTRRDPALLAELYGTPEPTTEQRDAVERLLTDRAQIEANTSISGFKLSPGQVENVVSRGSLGGDD